MATSFGSLICVTVWNWSAYGGCRSQDGPGWTCGAHHVKTEEVVFTGHQLCQTGVQAGGAAWSRSLKRGLHQATPCATRPCGCLVCTRPHNCRSRSWRNPLSRSCAVARLMMGLDGHWTRGAHHVHHVQICKCADRRVIWSLKCISLNFGP